MSKISEVTAKTKEGFLDRSRDLFACLTNTPEDVFKRVLAAMKLDRQLNEDFIFFSEGIGQAGHAGTLAEKDLAKSLNHAIAVCFMRCFANGVITQAVRLTDEADDQLMQIKIDAGLEKAPAPKAPAAPIKSAQEQFDDLIRNDWATLPTDKIKAKKNASAAYRKRLAELLDSGAIESQITKLHDINEVGG
jgi:hypothetical protein